MDGLKLVKWKRKVDGISVHGMSPGPEGADTRYVWRMGSITA